jgi:protein SCO1/2
MRFPTRELLMVSLLVIGLLACPIARAQEEARVERLEALTDQSGAQFLAARIAGRPYALFFGFTHCPDICPTTLLQVSNHLRQLGADADLIVIIFVTVDPERDRPDILKDYLTSFDPRIIALTGTPAQIQSVAAAWKAVYDRIDEGNGNYTIAHSAHVYLMDGSGRQHGTLNFREDETVQLAKLKDLIAASR